MSRRSAPAVDQLATVAATYAALTNSKDFGSANANRLYRLRLMATAAAEQRIWVIASNQEITDPATNLADVTKRRVGFVTLVSVDTPQWQEFIFNSPFRYIYLLSETGACVVDIEADEGI